jgi:hypothetical protein
LPVGSFLSILLDALTKQIITCNTPLKDFYLPHGNNLRASSTASQPNRKDQISKVHWLESQT